MPGLAATLEPAAKNVRLDYTVPATGASLTLTRTGPSGVAAAVRAWEDRAVVPGPVIARDFEVPIGVPLIYRAEVRNAAGAVVYDGEVANLVTNPRAGVDLTGYGTPSAGVVNTRITSGAPGGYASGIEHVGTSVASTLPQLVNFGRVGVGTGTSGQPVKPDTRYAARVIYELLGVSLGNVTQGQLRLYWYNAAGSPASVPNTTMPIQVNPVPGTDYTIVGFATSPPDAAFCTPRLFNSQVNPSSFVVRSTGALLREVSAAETVVPAYVDGDMDGYVWSGTPHASTTLVATATAAITVPSDGCDDQWLTDLARAGNTQQIVVEQLPELAYVVPVTVHDVITRRSPIVASDIAHTPELELSFLTDTDAAREQAKFTLGNGFPVLLRTPPEDGIGNLYLAVLGYVEQRIVSLGTQPARRFVVQGRQVERPDAALYQPAAPVTYAYTKSQFATYAALKAGRTNYDAVAYDWAGASPADVFPWPPNDV